MALRYRAGIIAAASAMALSLAIPAASAESPPIPEVNGHTDNWVNEGSASVTYDNGTTLTRQDDVLEALQQCNWQSVSCRTETITVGKVTKWYDAENTVQNVGPIQNCGANAKENITQAITASHAFSWGWNIGVSVDLSLVKDKLGIGASAGFSQTTTETQQGTLTINVPPGQKGMLKMGYDMDRNVSEVSIKGGKLGGAKITELRTEIPRAEGKRVDQDVVPCGQTLLNGR
ncbi:hypothetical protein [Streptomyces sp. Isolate_219]|uniref:hypothetical protein n=1 Tax=Streptomyces sp. Isolate_219 TaxID=2950110 RepID=UPI0021C5F554|nr:hypothetical protein [Streptomyces sp. Isolate_219]MCR8579692.1 hypothetical protein [Streptomyces sp. Isolate_219]